MKIEADDGEEVRLAPKKTQASSVSQIKPSTDEEYDNRAKKVSATSSVVAT
jgi:hypothetical protein